MPVNRLISLIGAIVLAVSVPGCREAPEKDKAEYLKSGDGFAAQSKWAEAVIEYRNALRIDNLFGEAHDRLAEAYLHVDPPNVEEAIRQRIAAADILTENRDVQLKASQALLAAGRYQDAQTYANNVLKNDPRNVPALLVKGGAAAQLKDMNLAVDTIKQAIKIAPDDARPYASLGALEFGSGKREEAEAAFKQAVQLDPKSRIARAALAQFYWMTGRPALAEPELKQMIALDPKDLSTQEALATFYQSTDRAPEAEAPLKAVADGRKDIPSRLALADYYIRAQRYDEAVTILKTVAAEKSGGTGGALRLAAIDFSKDLRPDAYRQVETVLTKEPANVDALSMKARFLMVEGKLGDALASAKAATAADPKSVDARYLLGSIQSRRNEPDEAISSFNEVLALNPLARNAQLQIAALRLQQGSTDAVQLAQANAKSNPKDLVSRLVLARALMLRGDLSQSQEILKSLLAEHDGVATVHTQMGVLRMLQKDTAGARKEFDRALALSPDEFEALRGKVMVEAGEKNFAGARAAIDAQLQKSPSQPDLLLLSARTYATAGDMAQAEKTFRRLVEVDPANEAGFSALAELYGRQGNLDAAKAQYEAMAKQNPKSVAAPTMVALILEAQRKPKEAQKVYETVLATSPTAAVAANNLAMLYAESGANLDVALELAQTAKRQAPDSPMVDDTLGWVYYKRNLPTLAIPQFEASIKADPKNAEFRYHLGLAHLQAGNRVKALGAFDEALKLNPGHREAEAARVKLSPRR